ncbi:MAG: hypothetical protein WCH04_14185 [Gammaproteobacteria bacterium]
MATSPSVLTLAGPPGDNSRHLLLIGVQPLEFEDFGSGVRPAVKRRLDRRSARPTVWLAGASRPFSAWRRGKRR